MPSHHQAIEDRHPSITTNAIMAAVERRSTSLDNPGFCIACGLEHEGCEPDACNYPCESCGENAVFGAEELLLHIIAQGTLQ